MCYDFDRLREDLMDHIGTAGGFIPSAMSEMAGIDRASDGELLNIARRNGFALGDYELDPDDY